MGVFRQILETIVGFIHRNPLLFLLLVVLAIGMPGLFGVLAFVLAIPALIILIMACLLGWQLLRLHRRSEEAFGSQTRDFRDNGSKRREGDVTIVRTDRDSKRVSEKVGEYVDYKEVKEKKITMLKIFELIGRYCLLMRKVFSRPEKASIYWRRIVFEIEALGINSIGLTAIISVFIGAAITLQMSISLESPFIPQYLIGYATRETMTLEFSSTVVALILAGKVGSNIASEIGTMRITEQIDALEIMGVNSASYLILPKIVATVFFFPFLTLLSIIIGIVGGYSIAWATGIMLPDDYVEGLLYDFVLWEVIYSLIKIAVFAFIITSISAFCGYYAKGNSLEVGRASTRAVVVSSIVIMIFNLILTQILLT